VGGKPHEALVVDLGPQRIETGNADLNAQVLLLAVDKVGLHELPGDDGVVLVLQVGLLADDLDAPPAGAV